MASVGKKDVMIAQRFWRCGARVEDRTRKREDDKRGGKRKGVWKGYLEFIVRPRTLGQAQVADMPASGRASEGAIPIHYLARLRY
jgi:hypothetical protein